MSDMESPQPKDEIPQNSKDNHRPAWLSYFSRWWLAPRDQLVVMVICTILVAWAVYKSVERGSWYSQQLEINRPETLKYRYQIDINRANWIEWALLDGIGETLAQKIVAYRDEQGQFSSIDELLEIPGIGPKTLDDIRPHLTIDQSGTLKKAPPEN